MFPPPTTIACLGAELVDVAHGPRDRCDPARVLAVLALAHERLAGKLEQDAPEDGTALGGAHSAPTSNRANRLISMFSPIVPESSARSVSSVLPSSSGRIDGWFRST